VKEKSVITPTQVLTKDVGIKKAIRPCLMAIFLFGRSDRFRTCDLWPWIGRYDDRHRRHRSHFIEYSANGPGFGDALLFLAPRPVTFCYTFRSSFRFRCRCNKVWARYCPTRQQ